MTLSGAIFSCSCSFPSASCDFKSWTDFFLKITKFAVVLPVAIGTISHKCHFRSPSCHFIFWNVTVAQLQWFLVVATSSYNLYLPRDIISHFKLFSWLFFNSEQGLPRFVFGWDRTGIIISKSWYSDECYSRVSLLFLRCGGEGGNGRHSRCDKWLWLQGVSTRCPERSSLLRSTRLLTIFTRGRQNRWQIHAQLSTCFPHSYTVKSYQKFNRRVFFNSVKSLISLRHI